MIDGVRKLLSIHNPVFRGLLWSALIIGTIHVVMIANVAHAPGRPFSGEPPPLKPAELQIRNELSRHIHALAVDIGPKNLSRYENIEKARHYITREFQSMGYTVTTQTYNVGGIDWHNIAAEKKGTSPNPLLYITGSHYDTAGSAPGADDNISGVAGTLLLAAQFKDIPTTHSIRFVAFVNEEPPYFQTADMGSHRYAQACHLAGDKIAGMFTLESIGYFSDQPKSQNYPPLFNLYYPSVGNFVAFVSDTRSAPFMREAIGAFRQTATIPSHAAAAPEFIPGIGFSDHWSFWQFGIPAFMITDTAPYRNPHYHMPTDTVDTLDFDRMTRVVSASITLLNHFLKPTP